MTGKNLKKISKLIKLTGRTLEYNMGITIFCYRFNEDDKINVYFFKNYFDSGYWRFQGHREKIILYNYYLREKLDLKNKLESKLLKRDKQKVKKI